MWSPKEKVQILSFCTIAHPRRFLEKLIIEEQLYIFMEINNGFKVHDVIFFDRDYNLLYSHPDTAETTFQHYISIKQYTDQLSKAIKVDGDMDRISMGNFDLIRINSNYISVIYLMEKSSESQQELRKTRELFERHLRVLIEENIENPNAMCLAKGNGEIKIDNDQIKSKLVSLLESNLL